MIMFSDVDNHADKPLFVSYRTQGKLLAEVLNANNIKGVELKSSDSGIRAGVDEDGSIVVACEGLDDIPSFPQALARAWVNGAGITGLMQYKELDARNLTGDRQTPAEKYRLTTPFDGSEAGKLNVLHDIFTETDILSRMDIEETRIYKATRDQQTKLGNFGNDGEKFVFGEGRLKGYSAKSCGDTVIDYDNGKLTLADCGEAKWSDRMIQNTMEYLTDRSRTAGVDTIEKINCPQIFMFTVPVQCTKVAENAFDGCEKLRSVTISRKDTKLGKGFIKGDIRLKGDKGSTAEKYSQEENAAFEPELLDISNKKLVNLTENISLALPSESSYAVDSDTRGYFYELFTGEEYIDAQADIFVNDDNAAQSFKAKLLENTTAGRSENAGNGVIVCDMTSGSMKIFCIEIANGSEKVFIHTVRKAADKDIFELFKSIAADLDIEAAAPAQTEAVVEEPVPAAAPAVEEIAQPEPVVETVQPEPVVETVQPEPVAEPVAEPAPAPAPAPAAQPVSASAVQPAKKLVRGERMTLDNHSNGVLNVTLKYEGDTDIDGYMFLLKSDGKVRSDADLVFFGQQEASNGAVKLVNGNNKSFDILLDKVDNDIEKISAAYAVYGDDESKTFGTIKNAVIEVTFEGRPLCEYALSGLDNERSAVTVELYRKGGWKLRTIGQGYNGALKSLCESFGVAVQ